MNTLDIYVWRHCFGYDEAFRLAYEIGQSLPHLQVEVRIMEEISEHDLPEIIATPSYFLNGRLLFLGNPWLDELIAIIASPDSEKGENIGGL